jgi:hypothetical protein
MKVSWHRYVRLEDIPAFLAVGWEWDDRETPLHSPHGFYSVLMTWGGSGEPVEPADAVMLAVEGEGGA